MFIRFENIIEKHKWKDTDITVCNFEWCS